MYSNPFSLVGEQIDKWRLKKQIGEGGMSVVYLGEHSWLSIEGAVKILRPELSMEKELLIRFQQEALAASQLDHENIVHIYDFGYHEKYGYFMVLEYLDGYDLEYYIEQAPFRKDWILHITKQICSGLEATHRAKIIHRDLKPSNIFLLPTETGLPHVKILDFGIAKDYKYDKKLTQTGSILGTPAYLAPEQIQRTDTSSKIYPTADIYSLGVMLYQLFTGKLPIDREGFVEHFIAILHQDAPLAGNLRPELTGTELEAFLAKILSKDPKDRFQTAEETLKALEDALESFDDPLVETSSFPDIQGRLISPKPNLSLRKSKRDSSDSRRVTAIQASPEKTAIIVDKEFAELRQNEDATVKNSSLYLEASLAETLSFEEAEQDELLKRTIIEKNPLTARYISKVILLIIILFLPFFLYFRLSSSSQSQKSLILKKIVLTSSRPISKKKSSHLLKKLGGEKELKLLDSLVAEGTVAFRKKDYRRAIHLWKKVIHRPLWQRSKSYPKLYKAIGVAMARRNLHYSAMRFYERYLETSKISPQEREYIKKKLLPKMNEELRRRMKLASKILKKMWEFAQKEKWHEVRKLYEKIKKIAPSIPEVHEKAARILQKAHPEESFEIYKRILKEMELSNKETARIIRELNFSKDRKKKKIAQLKRKFNILLYNLKKGKIKRANYQLNSLLRRYSSLLFSKINILKIVDIAIQQDLSLAIKMTLRLLYYRRKLDRSDDFKLRLGRSKKNICSVRKLRRVLRVLKSLERAKAHLIKVRILVIKQEYTKASSYFKKFERSRRLACRWDRWKYCQRALKFFPSRVTWKRALKAIFRIQDPYLRACHRGDYAQVKKLRKKLNSAFLKWRKFLSPFIPPLAVMTWQQKLVIQLAELIQQYVLELDFAERAFRAKKWRKAEIRYKAYLEFLPAAKNRQEILKKIRICRCKRGLSCH